MDQVLQIFKQLGVDQSVFYQFGLFFILFFILKYTFFNKLLFVIQTREEKTTKLDGNADKKFNEADKLSEKLDEELEKINSEAQTFVSQEKEKVLEVEKSKTKAVEEKNAADYEKRKSEMVAEVESQRLSIMKQSESLTNELVTKLTN